MPKVRRRVPVKKRTALVSRTRSTPKKLRRRSVLLKKNSRTRPSGHSSSSFIKKTFQLIILSLTGLLLLGFVVLFLLSRQADWNQKDQLTVLLIDRSQEELLQSPLHILTISEADQDVALLSLPPKLQLRALRQYGEFSSDSLYSLYQQEQLPDRYVEGTVTYNLGIVVDQRMLIDQPITDIQNVQKVFFSSLFHLNGGSLKWGDRLHIWSLLARYGQVINIGTKYDLFDEISSSVVRLNPSVMDTVVTRYFNRPQFIKSHWTIAVINLTQESGVATFWGKRMKQAGFQLINVDSLPSEDTTQKSIIYLSQKAFDDQQVIETLQSLFPIELEFQVDPQITQRYRSDVVVYISDNLVREYP